MIKMWEQANVPANQFVARTIAANPKCTGCLHYDTHRTACLVSLMPQSCGDGEEPELGYAPLSQLKPGGSHIGPSVGAAQAVAGPSPTANNLDMDAMPIEYLGEEAPQMAAFVASAAQALMAKSGTTCIVHSLRGTGTINPALAGHMGAQCTCNHEVSKSFAKSFYDALSPRYRYAYSEDVVKGHLESAVEDELEKAGAGSRGGKIAYYTKTGKPVYQSKVKKMAPQMDKMMENWHHNAQRSGHPEDHAIAAKQAHAAAFYHHHAGDSAAAHQAMDYAEHHTKAYKEKGHKSRTTKWNDQHHEDTKKLTGWSSDEDDAHVNPKSSLQWRHGKEGASEGGGGGMRSHSHAVAGERGAQYHISSHKHPAIGEEHKVDHNPGGGTGGLTHVGTYKTRKEAEAGALAHHHSVKKSFAEVFAKKRARPFDLSKSGAGSRGGKVIGTTRSGKPIYEPSRAYRSANHKFLQAVRAHGHHHPEIDRTSAVAQAEHKAHMQRHEGFSADDHKDAVKVHVAADRGSSSEKTKDMHRVIANTHHHASEKMQQGGTPWFHGDGETKKSLTFSEIFKATPGAPKPAMGGASAWDAKQKQLKTTQQAKAPAAPKAAGTVRPVRPSTKAKFDAHYGAGTPIQNSQKKDENEDELSKCNTKKSFADVLKGGAGSRGGKILGYTRSGKPVYSHSDKYQHAYNKFFGGRRGKEGETSQQHVDTMKQEMKAHAEKHKDFSEQDHEDAHHIHLRTFSDVGSSHRRQAQLRVASEAHHSEIGGKPKYKKDFEKVHEESKKPASWDWENPPKKGDAAKSLSSIFGRG